MGNETKNESRNEKAGATDVSTILGDRHPKMLLEREVSGNGHFCSCCGDDWERVEWVKPESVSLEKLVAEAFEIISGKNGRYVLSKQYEWDGEILFGFKFDGHISEHTLLWNIRIFNGDKEFSVDHNEPDWYTPEIVMGILEA